MCHPPSQGNHKKATKLLLMAVQNRGQNGGDQQQSPPPPTVESLNVSDPYVMSLYHNNLGCINMATGRPNAARFNLHDAINLHNTATSAGGGGGRMAERQESCLQFSNTHLLGYVIEALYKGFSSIYLFQVHIRYTTDRL